MTPKTEQRRADLRVRIVDAAEAAILEGGIGALKARALAQEAGCAVGALYNVFDDMTGIVLAVNGRTFQRLGAHIAAALEDGDTSEPVNALIVMAKAYHGFAAENTRAWRALFDVEMVADSDVPEWYLEELGKLFALIAAPLTRLHPHKPQADIETLTRALFSSVHGIVLLGLENRISAVPRPEIERMLEVVLTGFAAPSKQQ